MAVTLDDQEVAMTVLCGLSLKYENLIVAIDVADDDDRLTLDFSRMAFYRRSSA